MKLLLAVVISLLSASAFSQSKIVSIDAFDYSYTGGLSLKHEEGKDVSDKDTNTFKFNINYAQNLENYVGLMWKAQGYLNRENVDFGSSDTLSSAFGGAGGVVYNFQADDIKNSALVSMLLGLEWQTLELAGGDDESGFNLFVNLEAGKRWDMGSYSVANISYAPTILLQLKRYGGDIRDEYFTYARDLRFNFLKFDILF